MIKLSLYLLLGGLLLISQAMAEKVPQEASPQKASASQEVTQEEATEEAAPQKECPECTQAERDQLRIRTAHRMAASLNELLEQLEQLARYPEAAALLLADKDQLLRHRLQQVLTAMRGTHNKPAPVVRTVRRAVVKAKPGPRGLAGLHPVYAQPADAARGIQASAILQSQGRAIPLSPGSQFSHNGGQYKLQDVRRGTEDTFEILLQRSDGKRETLTWQ